VEFRRAVPAALSAAFLVVQALLAASLVAVSLPGGPVGPADAHGGTTDNFTASGAVYTVAWSNDGLLFAAGTASGNITVYSGTFHYEMARWHAHDGPINQVVFSPDGLRIASVSGAYRSTVTEKTLKVWNLTGALLLNITNHYDWVTSVAWSPDGTMIASSSGVDNHVETDKIYGEVKFWNANTGALLWNASAATPQFAEASSYAARIAWAPDGHAVAALGHLNDLWLLYPYEQPRRMEEINHSYRDIIGHASHGWAIAWSPDSRLLVGGFSYDFTRPSAQSADFNPDGSTDSGPVIVFDPSRRNSEGFAIQTMRAEIHSRPAEWVSWDSQGQYIASCSGADLIDARGSQAIAGQDGNVDAGELVIYNYTNSTGTRLQPVNVWIFGHSWCSAVTFRPGNQTVLAGNADGTVKLYVFDYDGDKCMAWEDDAPADATICTSGGGTVSNPLDTWGLPILLLLGAGAAAAGLIFVRRAERRELPPASRRNGARGADRTATRTRSVRRR
jgi:WD40 repeat protein